MRALPAAVLTGVGLAMTLDEIVFHQLLGWHNLVDSAGVTSDAVLHAVGTLSLVAGIGLLALAHPWDARRVAGGLLTGAGGFNLFDGVVDHKVLRLHQIRDVADTTAYDVVWIAGSAAVLLAGLLVLRRAPATQSRRGRPR